MPTFQGYGGYQSRPKRKRQLDLAPVRPSQPIPLRATCPHCGHKNTVVVPAAQYYRVGFRLATQCDDCGKPFTK